MAQLTSPTLERLIKEIRVFLNQQKASNSFWSDEELTMYINDGIRLYFQKINEFAEGQFDKQIDLDVVADTETVSLPSDFFEIKTLYSVQNTAVTPLVYQNNISESYRTSESNGSNTYTPSYYFRGDLIVLRPIPSFSQTGQLRLEYTAFPETLISGLDAMTSGISPVFKELIVAYAIYKAKIKESSVNGQPTYTAIAGHLSDLTKQFEETVTLRSKYPQFVKPWIPE